MKKERSKILSLLVITMFCLLLGFKVGAFVFGALTIVKGIKYWQDPDRNLKERILNDAKLWEVVIPNSFIVRKKLFGLYRRIKRIERSEVAFITSFSIVLDEFWQQAATFESEAEWLENLSYLERNIPKASVDRNALSEALSDMQNLNFQMQSATVEVKKYRHM